MKTINELKAQVRDAKMKDHYSDAANSTTSQDLEAAIRALKSHPDYQPEYGVNKVLFDKAIERLEELFKFSAGTKVSYFGRGVLRDLKASIEEVY